MLPNLKKPRDSDESGFTLIELLVVILIIGILAAIALPAFLGQDAKAQDAAAQSNARNIATQLESYYTTEQRYTAANNSDEVTKSGIPVGAGKGKVTLTLAAQTYKVVAYSQSGTKFTIAKAANGTVTRTCNKKGAGDCPRSGKW